MATRHRSSIPTPLEEPDRWRPSRTRSVKQATNICGGQFDRGEFAAVEDAAEQLGLASLECHDLLLDGVLGDEAVDHDVAGLADAVETVHCLCLRRGVPPWVEEDAVVGLGQVQAEAA